MFDLAFACVNIAADEGDAATQVQQLAFKKIIFVMEDVDAASKARRYIEFTRRASEAFRCSAGGAPSRAQGRFADDDGDEDGDAPADGRRPRLAPALRRVAPAVAPAVVAGQVVAGQVAGGEGVRGGGHRRRGGG